MKNISFILFALILAACGAATPTAPQVTVTREAEVTVTLTPAPTFTPMPTATLTTTPTPEPTPSQQADLEAINKTLDGAYQIVQYKEGDKTYASFVDAKTGETIPEMRIDENNPEYLTWSRVYEYRGHKVVIPQSMDKVTINADGQIHFDFPGYEWKDGKFEQKMVEDQPLKNAAEAQIDMIIEGGPTHTLLGINELGNNGDGYLKSAGGGFSKGKVKFAMDGMHWRDHILRIIGIDGAVSDIETTDYRLYNTEKNEKNPKQVLFFMGKDKRVHSILVDSYDPGWKNTEAWGEWGNYPDMN